MINIQQLLKQAGAQQVGTGIPGMQAMAVDGTQILNILQQLSDQVNELATENAELREKIASGNATVSDEPKTPRLEDFYVYGDAPFTNRLTDNQVQLLIDQAAVIPVDEYGFVEVTDGDTFVAKLVDRDTIKYVVARGYSEFVVDVDGDEDPGCGCAVPCSPYSF